MFDTSLDMYFSCNNTYLISCIYSIYTVYIQYIYNIYTVYMYIQYIYSIYTVYIYIYNVCILICIYLCRTEICQENEIVKKCRYTLKLIPMNPQVRTYYISFGSQRELTVGSEIVAQSHSRHVKLVQTG